MDMLGILQVDILNFTGSIYLLFTEMNPEFINFVYGCKLSSFGSINCHQICDGVC